MRFECNFCDNVMRVPDHAAGKRIRCKACSQTQRVPDRSSHRVLSTGKKRKRKSRLNSILICVGIAVGVVLMLVVAAKVFMSYSLRIDEIPSRGDDRIAEKKKFRIEDIREEAIEHARKELEQEYDVNDMPVATGPSTTAVDNSPHNAHAMFNMGKVRSWQNAQSYYEDDLMKVEITNVLKGKLTSESPLGEEIETENELLEIKVKVTNKSDTEPLYYSNLEGMSEMVGSAILTDEQDKHIKGVYLIGVGFLSERGNHDDIPPGKSENGSYLFDLPPKGARNLRLSIPKINFNQRGVIQLVYEVSKIQKR